MKNPISILSTDWHLNKFNILEVLDIVNQQIELAKKLNVNILFGLGDFFDTRKAQEEIVLNTFGFILRSFELNNIKFIGIKGNHDSVNNTQSNSYLTPFQYHPNFTLVSDYYIEKCNGINCHFLSYFDEDIYIDYLNKINTIPNELNYLFTHIGIDGVLNNSNENVQNPVKKELFQGFDKVFIGHYHNSSIHGNIEYIGSVQPKDFGENNNKGCTILYEDGSHELIKLSFKEYKKISIDVNSFDKKKEQKLLQEYSDSNDYIRFEFTGDSSKLKSLDKIKYQKLGIDIKVKTEVEETVNVSQHDEFIEFNNETLLKEFDEFCQINELTDIEIGKEYLEQKLND